MQAAKNTPVNLQEWAVSLLERHQRKSHLPPPMTHAQPTIQPLAPSTSRHTNLTVQPLMPSTSRTAAPSTSMHLSPQPPSRSADIPMAGLSLGGDSASSEARPFPVRTSSVQRIPRKPARPVGMMAPHPSTDERPLPNMPADKDERMYN